MSNTTERINQQTAVITELIRFLNDDFVSTLLAATAFVSTAVGTTGLAEDFDVDEALDLSENGLRTLLGAIANEFGIELDSDQENAGLVEFHDHVARGMRNDR